MVTEEIFEEIEMDTDNSNECKNEKVDFQS